jgi:hypothetical protein
MPEILYLRLFIFRRKLWQDLNVLIAKKNLKRIGLSGFSLHLSIGLVRDILAVLIVTDNHI